MDKYIEAEGRLVELISTRTSHQYNEYLGAWVSEPPTGHKATSYIHQRYCRDDAAAFRLMVEHEINIDWRRTLVDTKTVSGDEPDEYVLFSDHPDKAAALRYSIVMTVIQKLQANQP